MQFFNQQVEQEPTFKVGDHVWLDGKNLKVRQLATKLGPQQHGSFPISEKIGQLIY